MHEEDKMDARMEMAVRDIIREEFTRLRNSLTGVPGGLASDCGCFYDQGCCRDQGCCNDKGCCGQKNLGKLDELTSGRFDVLQEFILSNKEPIIKFFKERGVEVNL
jgi:hypothetical protein